MSERKDSTINVDKETLGIYQKVSDLTGIPISKLLRDVAGQLQAFMTERNPDKMNLLVDRRENVVVVYLAAMYCGKVPIPESLSKRAQEFVEHEMVDAHIEKRKRNRK
jgi:hypothetical protein